MIEKVEQTPFQQVEATQPNSLARNMLALLIRRERIALHNLQAARAKPSNDPNQRVWIEVAQAKWLANRSCAETCRRVLYGWEP